LFVGKVQQLTTPFTGAFAALGLREATPLPAAAAAAACVC
jgi:hypothetical protein